MPALPFAPWRTSGTVVGALLNDPALLHALGDAVEQPPYRGAPRAAVLQVKPRHTFNVPGGAFEVADDPVQSAEAGEDSARAEVEIGATLALVVGRAASRIAVEEAAAHVAGWMLVADLRLPLASHYRPGVRRAARDGSCFLGPALPFRDVPDPAAVPLAVTVGGRTAPAVDLAGLQRPWDRLLADVSAFMTLLPGDLLLLGSRHPAPRGRAGETFLINAAPFGQLSGHLVGPGAGGAP